MIQDRDSLFPKESVGTLSEVLQGSLYDLAALARIIKQAHWNLKGKHFRPLHLHLDEIYAVVDEATDQVAERLATVGVSPSGQAKEVAKNTTLEEIPLGFLKDTDVVDLMTDRVGNTCLALRQRMEKIEDVDPVTADMFHGILEDLEKHHWMLRSQKD